MKKLLITNAVPSDVLEPLAGVAEVIQGPGGGNLMTRDEVLRLAPELDGIINQAELRVDAELLDAAKRLKIVANVALGTDNLDLNIMAQRGVWATNVPGAFVESTADCTLGLMLGIARRLAEADRHVRAGLWKSFQPGVWDGVTLCDKTLGIIGYGKIGQAVAKRARAFGMKILWTREAPCDDPEYCSLDELLRMSDFVSLHTPLTPQTHHLMNDVRFAQMKPGAFLINMARGKVVEEAALVRALEKGRLAGAGLDVFEFEPKVCSELLQRENVFLSPHIGGGTVESRHEARLTCVRNVAEVLAGRPPLTPVNKPEFTEGI